MTIKKKRKRKTSAPLFAPFPSEMSMAFFCCCCCCCCCIDGNRWKSWCYRVFFLFKKKRFSFHTAEPVRSSWADAITGLYRVYIYIFFNLHRNPKQQIAIALQTKTNGPNGDSPEIMTLNDLDDNLKGNDTENWVMDTLGLPSFTGFKEDFTKSRWVSTGFYQMWLDFQWFDEVSLGFTEFYWVLVSMTGF